MPRVSRRRVLAAPPAEVWALVSDPYGLPRWWPRTARVEGVEPSPSQGLLWTKVLATAEGRGVRADFHCTASEPEERFAWEQQLAGTPFERHLRGSAVEISLQPQGAGTKVEISSEQRLRGLSRLGGALMRRGQGQTLEEALDGLEQALT